MQNISCLEITSGAKYLDTIYKERYYKLQNDSLKSESVVRINECYVFNQFQIKKVVNNIGENYFDVINHMFDYYHSKAEIPLSTWQLLCKLDKILENKEIYSDIFTLRHDQLTNYELHRYKGINIHAEKEYQDDQIDHTLERRKRKKLCDKRVSASNNSCYFS